MNKIKSIFNKVGGNYKSFSWFVVKLILWVFILAWLAPLLAGLFLNTFNKSTTLTVGDFILFITAAFIIAYTYETQKMREQIAEQTEATKKMTEYQLMPAVDVNMIYDDGIKKTYFWFSNVSNVPAFVSFGVFKKEGNKELRIHEQRLRIPPQCKMRTSVAYDFHPLPEKDVVLNVEIKPAYKDIDIKVEFTKSYKFHEFQTGLYRWDETSWGFPDLPYPDNS